ADEVALYYLSPYATDPSARQNISAQVRDVLPLDTTALGTTLFLIRIQPQSLAGTYSYAIGPDINDRIRSANTFVQGGGSLHNFALPPSKIAIPPATQSGATI